MQRPSSEIPPISFDPELPALPRGSYDEGSSALQAVIPSTSESPTAKEPMQVVKVMPQEPEKVEITTETLEAALSDIYFDYDRFSIREDAMVFLKANAHLITAKFAEKNIVIEGHCDERGTQSYNMVLGEARANAVKTFLEDLGISSDKLEVVSYGKDKPFCREQTEECWQENRRGHFVIK
jgi:peptidoglycan-associated lipoprotein